jgi:methyl-accepting chemotaxis protein
MMPKIKLDSIKGRLLIITVLCLIAMLILIGNQLYNTDRLIALNNQSKQLLQLDNELLQLRRDEKDFLLRLDKIYVMSFEQRAKAFQAQLRQIQTFFTQLDGEQRMFSELQNSVDLYRKQFANLVAIQDDIGLDENSGYQGSFRRATHALEEEFEERHQVELQILLLQMRRSEKDFLLRKRVEYIQQQSQRYDQLHVAVERSQNRDIQQLLPLLEDYQRGFANLTSAYQTIGLDHTMGLKAAFRQQTHLVEEQLNNLDDNLATLIAKTEQQVERMSLIIMAATSATLLILLIKSFITFQRAFANFVMFFHRCKREYQRLDEKKLGFSEFKYLGAMANEMIGARREMELKLQKANNQIAELEQNQ